MLTKEFNPLPTIGNSLVKQKSLYKVLTPSIKPRARVNSYGLMGAHDVYNYVSLVGKGLGGPGSTVDKKKVMGSSTPLGFV